MKIPLAFVATFFCVLLNRPLAGTSAGHSHTVGGVNFDEFSYVDTARNNKVIKFHAGHFEDPQGDLPSTIDVEDVVPGRLDGKTVAVVLQRGEGPGGYDEWADLFEIAGNRARNLGSVGSFDFYQTGEGPQPQSWYAFHFSKNRLFADIWNREARCDRHRDWLVTTYELHSGKLVAVNKMAHHRAGAPLPKRNGPNPGDCF